MKLLWRKMACYKQMRRLLSCCEGDPIHKCYKQAHSWSTASSKPCQDLCSYSCDHHHYYHHHHHHQSCWNKIWSSLCCHHGLFEECKHINSIIEFFSALVKAELKQKREQFLNIRCSSRTSPLECVLCGFNILIFDKELQKIDVVSKRTTIEQTLFFVVAPQSLIKTTTSRAWPSGITLNSIIIVEVQLTWWLCMNSCNKHNACNFLLLWCMKSCNKQMACRFGLRWCMCQTSLARSIEHLKQNSPMSLSLIKALLSSGNSCHWLGGSSSIVIMHSHCLFLGILC